jgi:metal-responsive CopG/Arc/MetJ family transcriptional regulator
MKHISLSLEENVVQEIEKIQEALGLKNRAEALRYIIKKGISVINSNEVVKSGKG